MKDVGGLCVSSWEPGPSHVRREAHHCDSPNELSELQLVHPDGVGSVFLL